MVPSLTRWLRIPSAPDFPDEDEEDDCPVGALSTLPTCEGTLLDC